MDKIGIMQGRIFPPRLDEFQVFPIANWEKELVMAKKGGFRYVEILYDKDLVCKAVLQKSENIGKFGITFKTDKSKPAVNSMCLDYLASIPALNSWDLFSCSIEQVVGIVKNTSIKILVIPFFDENTINSQEELELLFNLFREKNLDGVAVANDIFFALELSLSAYQIREILEKYKFSNIKICYDTGNAKALGYSPENEIIELGDFICHVHIKDRKVNGPNVMLGKGAVDFMACFKAFENINYKGLMILETKYCVSPFDEAVRNLQFVKAAVRNN